MKTTTLTVCNADTGEEYKRFTVEGDPMRYRTIELRFDTEDIPNFDPWVAAPIHLRFRVEVTQ